MCLGEVSVVSKTIHRQGMMRRCDGDPTQARATGLIAAGAVLLGISAWSYWGILVDLFKEWQGNDD